MNNSKFRTVVRMQRMYGWMEDGRSNEKTLTCCFMSHLYKQIWMQNLEVIDRIVVLLCFWFPFVVRAVMTNYV